MTNHHPGRDDSMPETEPPRRRYSFASGTLYATIRPARADNGHLTAQLEITSHANRDRVDVSTLLTIGHRRYTLTAWHRSMPGQTDRLTVVVSWLCDGRGSHSGCSHGRLHLVGPHSAAWTRLHAITRSVVRRFGSDVPDWQHDSLRLHWLGERETVLDTIMQLNLMLSEADTDLRSINATLNSFAARPDSTTEQPEPGRCVVLFCGVDAEWLVHARHKTLGFELKKPMCHGHAHHTGGSYDILSTEPIPTNPNPAESAETERS